MDRSVELEVLELAEPMLAQIFGGIEIDRTQVDRPDAAFFYPTGPREAAASPANRVGVEITFADRSDDLKYFNDEKMARKRRQARLEEVIKGSPPPPEGPLKKKSVPRGHDYLYEGVKKKVDRHAEYMRLGKFEQMVLLVASDFLTLRDQDFKYLSRWADHLMGRAHFPFSKVIFVCRRARDSALIFDKERPARGRPARKREREQGITRFESEIMPMGQASLGATFTGAAVLPQTDGRKRKR